ncbi:mechanosensitive ion channel family protein [Parasphingorhabdus halotolerans]|uniref:Small-conductance mechanosensitive channel n=1 Tax=Parasphingorhabdus halotolerans TaxID=2725558 RepID=A0A6H2DJI0_9SPHN|nr:mechanosensitive ion channel [Parasphingorhabdus halotolerans]QJB68839.1 mechanosensitive ion channel [Parasphingorhabdus halotolerans]
MSNSGAGAEVTEKLADKTRGSVEILTGQLADMWEALVSMVPGMLIALIVLILTWIISKFAIKITDQITKSASMRPSLRELIETLVRIAIWVIGLMIALTILMPGLTPASLIAGLGFGAVAIGFAFQDIFENFMAGILIMLREKMRIGDYIECEGTEGVVEHIALRETHIRKPNKELTIVPNSILFKNPVKILTDVEKRRHDVVCGVSYDTDLEEAREVILNAVKSADGVDVAEGIDVFACEFNSSSVDFNIRWWSGSKPRAMHESRDTVIRSVKRALDDAGIEIPFPYVTHTFKEPVPIAEKEES